MHREPSVPSKKFLVSFCMDTNTVKYSKLNNCTSAIMLIILSSAKEVHAHLACDAFLPPRHPKFFCQNYVEISSFVVSKMADCTSASPLQNFGNFIRFFMTLPVYHTSTNTHACVPSYSCFCLCCFLCD